MILKDLIIFAAFCLIITLVYAMLLVKQKNNSQPIYEDGPKWHQAKAGTPTKGGKIFVFPLLVVTAYMWFMTKNPSLIILFVLTLGSFMIGLIDDNGKIKGNDNQSGLSAKQKLILQFVLAIILDIWFLKTYGYINPLNIMIALILPFISMGLTNATNLTDGIDGLLGTVSIITFIPLFIISFINNNESMTYTLLALIIGLLIFLFFNKNPAQIFMGDTGSLTIGCIYTFYCVQLHLGWLTILLASLYIIEMFSVIIQVGYFKYTKKKYGEGKRILLMAPLHHHLEKKGWSENKIDLVFGSIQILISIIVLIIYFYIYA